MSKKLIGFGIGTVLCLLIYYYYLMVYRQETEPWTSAEETNTEAALYRVEEQIAILKRYDTMYRAIADNVPEKDYGMAVLPGLRATRSLTSDHSGRISMCTSITPQGICVTEKYLLVSGYCHTHAHNSVVFVIDKHTKAFVKEVVLQGKKHVGGLAYDPEHQMVWISTGYQGHAEVSAFSLASLLAYDLERHSLPIAYEKTYELHTLERDSFLTYADGCLYVGHFAQKGTSVLQKFRIREDGGLAVQPVLTLGTDREIAVPEDIKEIPARIQGMAILQDRVILTQSYGWSPSKLYVCKYSDFMHRTDSKYLLNEIVMPQKLEQVYADGDELYVLFESAAYAYRAQPLPKVDRICKLRLDAVMGEEGQRE